MGASRSSNASLLASAAEARSQIGTIQREAMRGDALLRQIGRVADHHIKLGGQRHQQEVVADQPGRAHG
ncbi:MAG: hypothetical protein H4O13_17725 [Xanthomonadales bacterium]|nr:hypothetical protein [Xanthomonadales bacterium]